MLYNPNMESQNLQFEIFDGFTLVTPRALGPAELDHLPSFVEDLLLQKKQDIVMSLAYIQTVFSSHLTAFVQVYRLLKSFNLRLIVVDISPAVLNVLQMTQLDSLLPLFLSLQDFRESMASNSTIPSCDAALDFTFALDESAGVAVARCKGYMAFGDSVRELQSALAGKPKIRLILSDVGYMDTRVLIMVSDLATRSEIEIQGASAVIRELFEQHRLLNKVTFSE